MENTQVGPFRIVKKLGSHRRHNVFHARQVEQDRDVALKFVTLPPDVDRNTALVKIEREVLVLRKMKHPNLVRVYGAGVHGEKVFFASEIVESEALSSVLARRGRLAPDLVVDLSKQVANALDYIHEQDILHCKLTSDKVLVMVGGKVKVTDLRLNRSRKRRWDASRRAQLETAAYLAPEQLIENGATVKSDLYSLGVIMFEMLTGRLPFEPETMAQLVRDKQESPAPRVNSIVPSCPGWLDQLVATLLHTDPRQRPHSAKAVEMALDQIRTIDQNKKTAAEEMTRGFSALTAGRDRTEARKLLGIKKERKQEERQPFLQSIPFLAGSLIAILIILALFFRPESKEAMLEQAAVYMKSSDPTDWRRARFLYQRVMDSRAPEELKQQATDEYYESRRRTLIWRAGQPLVGLEPAHVRSFYFAYQKQQSGDLDEALTLYDDLTEELAPDGEQRHIYAESKARRDSLFELKEEAKLARDEIAQMYEQGMNLDQKPDEAREIFESILTAYANNQFLKDELELVSSALDELPEVDVESEKESDSDTDSEAAPPSTSDEDNANGD